MVWEDRRQSRRSVKPGWLPRSQLRTPPSLRADRAASFDTSRRVLRLRSTREGQGHMGKIIGIDLGTTNSVVAIMDGKDPVVIANEEGARYHPVGGGGREGTASGWWVGGQAPGHHQPREVPSTPSSALWDEVLTRSQRRAASGSRSSMAGRTATTVHRASTGNPRQRRQRSRRRSCSSSQRRRRARRWASSHRRRVITVPAYFNDAQRQATRGRGDARGPRMCGASSTSRRRRRSRTAWTRGKAEDAVFDLGGGTFDVSLLTVEDGVFEVLATAGDTHLGGEDFDHA